MRGCKNNTECDALLTTQPAGPTLTPEVVFNEPPPLENSNLFDSDCALKEAVNREGDGWIHADARKLGELLGKPETINLGVLANRFTPELAKPQSIWLSHRRGNIPSGVP
jgi:hypothetical protein